MGKLNIYKEGISLLNKIKSVINTLYGEFEKDPNRLSKNLLPFLREARLLLQSLYSMDIIEEDMNKDDFFDQVQAFKAAVNRLPDEVRAKVRDVMREIYEPIQRDL